MTTARPHTSTARCLAEMLLLTVVLTYALTNIMLICGVALSPFIFPIAVIAMAIFGMFRGGLKATVAYFGLLAFSIAAAIVIYDYSWDGLVYHQQMIALLGDGWNPFRTENLTPDHLLWTNHYAKALETVSAAIAATADSIEAGKAVNFILFFSTVALSLAMTEVIIPQRGKWLRGAVALAIAGNPIVVSQLSSYFIDYAKYTCLLWTTASIYLMTLRRDKPAALTLGATIVLAIGVKFNIFFEEGLWIAGALVLLAVRGRRETALRVLWCGVAATVAGLLLSWHPYATNIITAGNPLYPLLGHGAVDIMTDNTPEIFGRGRIVDFFNSLFTLSLPTYQYRIGGYGLLMPLMLLCALYICLRNRRAFPAPLQWIIVGVFASCFIFEQSWWARYIAQLWFVPALALLWSLRTRLTPRTSALLLASMLLTAALSPLHDVYPVASTTLYRKTIYDTLEGDTVVLLNGEPQFRRVLRDHNISYRETPGADVAGGDTIRMFGYGNDPDVYPYPLLLLSPSQSERTRAAVGARHMTYDYILN